MGCDIHMVVQRRENAYSPWETFPELPTGRFDSYLKAARPIDDRNYTLFSVLANVRNKGNVPYIDEPRGIPEGFSLGFGERFLGDHSFSWVTFDEVLAYDWDRPFMESGIVSPDAAHAYRTTGDRPTEWCQGTTRPDWTRIEWPRTPREATGDWVGDFTPRLTYYGETDPANIRLVFGFDS